MKAVRLTKKGGSLNLNDESLPTPGPQQVLVRVHAASLNFRDQAALHDKYGGDQSRKTSFPYQTARVRS